MLYLHGVFFPFCSQLFHIAAPAIPFRMLGPWKVTGHPFLTIIGHHPWIPVSFWGYFSQAWNYYGFYGNVWPEPVSEIIHLYSLLHKIQSPNLDS